MPASVDDVRTILTRMLRTGVGVNASVVAEGSLKGSLFWNWEIDLMVGAAQDPYTLKTTDTTFALVKAHALKMHNASLSQIHSCDDYQRHPLY